MDLWGAGAFSTALALAVFDATFTVNVMRKYGVVAETNPGVGLFAMAFGEFGVYVGTILPTAAVLVAATLAQSKLALGAILGARLCLFHFQLLSSKLRAEMDALKGEPGQGTPPPDPNASKDPDESV